MSVFFFLFSYNAAWGSKCKETIRDIFDILIKKGKDENEKRNKSLTFHHALVILCSVIHTSPIVSGNTL